MLVLARFHRDIFASQTPRPATPHVSNTSLNTAIRNGSAAATVRACSFQAINGRLARAESLYGYESSILRQCVDGIVQSAPLPQAAHPSSEFNVASQIHQES